jgi:hypothetical protein
MRQGEINKGFDVLRERIPHPVLSKGKCEKLRKIDILHVAISYIRALENILESGDAGINEFANSLYSVVSPLASVGGAEGGSLPVASEAVGVKPPACSSPPLRKEADLTSKFNLSFTAASGSSEKAPLKIHRSLKW